MKLHRNIYLFIIVDFFSSLQIFTIIYLLYLIQLKISIAQIGLILMIYQVTKLIVEIPSGIIADKIGRKKCAIFGQICFIVFLVGTVVGSGFEWMITMSVFRGVSFAFLSGTLDSIFNESILLYSPELMNKLNSLNKLIFYLAVGFSALIGGTIATLGYKVVFIISIALQLISLVLIFFFEETSTIKSRKKVTLNGLVKYIIASKEILYLMLIPAILSVVLLPYEEYYPIILSKNGVPEMLIGLAVSANFIVGATMGLYTDRIIKKISYDQILRKFVYFVPVLFILLYFARNNLVVSWIFYCLAVGITIVVNITYNTCLQKEVETIYRGSILSVRSFLISITAMIVLPLVAHFSEKSDFGRSFLYLALISLILLVLNNFIHKSIFFSKS